MTRLLILVLFVSLLSYCNTNNDNELAKNQENEQQIKRQVEIKYFESEYGWGYDIIINGKKYIHQTHLPCECGGEGFKSKEKAQIAAEFLKEKIENRERNLQISRAQLDSLGAL